MHQIVGLARQPVILHQLPFLEFGLAQLDADRQTRQQTMEDDSYPPGNFTLDDQPEEEEEVFNAPAAVVVGESSSSWPTTSSSKKRKRELPDPNAPLTSDQVQAKLVRSLSFSLLRDFLLVPWGGVSKTDLGLSVLWHALQHHLNRSLLAQAKKAQTFELQRLHKHKFVPSYSITRGRTLCLTSRCCWPCRKDVKRDVSKDGELEKAIVTLKVRLLPLSKPLLASSNALGADVQSLTLLLPPPPPPRPSLCQPSSPQPSIQNSPKPTS